MTSRTEIIYHYRGLIERGPRYEWREGYSENSADGLPLYPWNTRGECRTDALRRGFIAVFYRDGKPEPTVRRRQISRRWTQQVGTEGGKA
jgi:hypothetical protein